MILTKKIRTYALIGTSTGLVLGCASLATGISLFFLNTQLDKNLKIYLIILGSVFMIGFIIAIVIAALIDTPNGVIIIHVNYNKYDITTNSNYYLINLDLRASFLKPITSLTVKALYLTGTNPNNKDIIFTLEYNDNDNIEILLPDGNNYNISIFSTNALGNSYETKATIYSRQIT